MKTKEEIEDRIGSINKILKFKIESFERNAPHLSISSLIQDRIDILTLQSNRASLMWVLNQEDDF